MSLSKTELLLTIQNEITKDHLEFDAFDRISKIYIAPSDAVDGDRCLVKEFIYHGLSEIVKGRKEGYSLWSSSFDELPDFLTDDLSNHLTDDVGNSLVEF